MNDTKEMVKIAYDAMNDHKGEDITIIDIADISTIADYFMIVNGNNPSHVSALNDAVQEKLGRAGYEPKRVEGIGQTGWILMDYGDLIIHVFSKDDRLFYDLERIWRDGKQVSIEEI